jgi:hypothetical protein
MEKTNYDSVQDARLLIDTTDPEQAKDSVSKNPSDPFSLFWFISEKSLSDLIVELKEKDFLTDRVSTLEVAKKIYQQRFGEMEGAL